MNATSSKPSFNYRRQTATTRTATKSTVAPLLVMAGLAALASSFLQVPRCSESTDEIQATPRILSNGSGEWWEAQAWVSGDGRLPALFVARDYPATQEELDDWPHEPTLKECAENYRKKCAAEQAKREVLKNETAFDWTIKHVVLTAGDVERLMNEQLFKTYTSPVFIPVVSGASGTPPALAGFTALTTIA